MSTSEPAKAGATVAIFGGSFNPPHVAHAMVCLYVLETQPVDAVWMIPCFRHPFEKQLAPYEDRVAMCALTVAPLRAVEVSRIEEDLGGESSRTFVTLEALAARHPGTRFRLIIGSDILRERDKWYRWADIERLAPPIVIPRAGYTDGATVLPEISSTDIRARVARGAPLDGLVPAAVARHIAERQLYRGA